MGLDVTHDCWHGSYSAFHRFRAELWDLAHPNRKGEWDKVTEGEEFLEFSRHKPAAEPLDYLLYHSDCDGDLKRYMLVPLAERLDTVAPFLSTEGAGHLARGARERALRFAAGCRAAHAAKETVKFW